MIWVELYIAYHVTSGVFQLCDTQYIGNHNFQKGVKDIVPINLIFV